jgi:fibronectin-binding autotransporter adhesin
MNIIRNKLYLQIPAVLVLALTLAMTQLAGAAATIWTNAAGGNWSVANNWSTLAVPGTADDVIFGNTGAGFPNTNDINSLTIDSLTYNQADGLQQTTVINPGQTLTIASSVAAGNAELYAGSTSGATTASTLVPAAVTGSSSTLALTGAGDIWVAQGNSTAGSHMATLNMSGLGTFNASVGRLFVGVNINGINRPSGTLLLAQTNNITLTGASPQVEVQESGVNANGGLASVLSFGQVNFLNADTMRFGGDKGNGTVNFAAAASGSPSLKIRNSDGSSPCTVIDFGYNDFVSSGNGTVCIADFSAGTVDLSANLVHIAQGNPGPGTGGCTSTVTLGAGTFDVPDLEIGWGNAAGANTGGTTATLNVNNNGLFGTGAVVIASSVLDLARTNGPVSTITGTLNINGGAVIANSITSGGGVSTINLNSGSLVVSNTAGSLSHPIGTFGIGTSGGATLSIPLSFSGSAVTVSNLTTGGANLINITAVPGIASYPVTFTIIQYQGTEGGSGAGTFTINSLPAASPSYHGTIVDTGNSGVVQVTLTSGPTTVLATTWTGATDNNWDYATMNWLYQGIAADFVDGRATIFNDSTTETNISLDASPLSPSSITVTNNLKQYTFGGSGYLTAGTLTKSGSSSLTLDNSGGNNNISTVVINGGTLQIGAGDAGKGGLSSVNITNNGALVVDRTDSVTLGSAISGTGTLTQGGGGTLILSGANTYNGATSLTNGTLEIDQTSSGTGPVTTSAGTVLSGVGVVNGPVSVRGELSPGTSAGGLGTFLAANGLTLATGGTVNFGLSPAAPNASDSVAVTNNLVVNNNTISVDFEGVPNNGDQFPLFTYSGSLSGSFNPVVTGTHFTVALDATSTPGTVYLDVTSGSGYALEWIGGSSSAWDNAATNWNNLGNSQPSTFLSGDSVLFDDAPGVQTRTITIGAGVTVYPSAITNASDNNYFTISGAGGIGGSTGIVKTNASTLVIATANSFTGPVDIQAGTLQTQNGAALGNAASITVENGATLDVDGQNLGGAVITASGAGVNGEGAIINSGAADFQAIRNLVLLGDTTLGGSAEWEMNNSGGAASLSTGGNPFNLTKVGANVIDFQNLATFDAALANIDIQGGTLLFNGITVGMGNPTNTLTIEIGAQLALASDQITYTKQIVINGDGTTQNINNEGGANVVLAGPIVLNGNCVFNVGGTQLIISNAISGSGGLIKSSGSPLILYGPNTYTGDTLVNAGTLQLVNGATLSTSSNITLAAGTTLDMQGTGLTLVSGQSLSGDGTVINSALAAGAGSTVSPGVIVTPGVDVVGLLTVNGTIALSGNTIMDLDPADGTNDVLKSDSTITYGGTLSLTNLSGPLTNGSSFKLFSASGYLGSFANITPATPGSGQAWDTSALRTAGTIKVVGTTPPTIGSIAVVGTNIVMSGSNGVASNPYYVLASTNVTLPPSNWSRIATNTFDGNGRFAFTNSLIPHMPQRFYRLELH